MNEKTLIDLILDEWPDWISVEDRLPEISNDPNGTQWSDIVLVSDGGYDIETAYYNVINKRWSNHIANKHWMPLPQYPTDKSKLIELLLNAMGDAFEKGEERYYADRLYNKPDTPDKSEYLNTLFKNQKR